MLFCRIKTPAGLGMELRCSASVARTVISLVAGARSAVWALKPVPPKAVSKCSTLHLISCCQELLVKDNC